AEDDDPERPDPVCNSVVPLPIWHILPFLLCVNGALGHSDCNLQNRCSRFDRRYCAVDCGTHVDHEYGGGILWSRFHCRAGASFLLIESRRSLAVALRDCGSPVCPADLYGSGCTVSGWLKGFGTAGGLDIGTCRNEESFRLAVLA